MTNVRRTKTTKWHARTRAALATSMGLALGGAAACGSSSAPVTKPPDLFLPKPECTGAPVVPYQGMQHMVMSDLTIGTLEDGFDLDGDGKPDTKLAAVAGIAEPSIMGAFADYSLMIPIEFFDFPTATADTCVKFSMYLGDYVYDGDGDMKTRSSPGGDCNDTDKTIFPGATEIVGNFKDDDCDGIADEDPTTNAASTDTMDRDGDGFSLAQGDCDDTDNTTFPGAPEICGDGKDNDCDGVADYHLGNDGVEACDPFSATVPQTIPLDPLSFDMAGAPLVQFTSGVVAMNGTTLQLTAGPSLFAASVPIQAGVDLDLRITGTTITADVVSDANGIHLANGKLGGIIDARTADTIRGLTVTQIGLTPDDSLLDAVFANLLGPLLAMPLAPGDILATYKGCRTMDIDVDHDGLEAFCDSTPDDDTHVIDICIDGDGTVIHDGDNGVVQCTDALDENNKPRFVDGISVEMNFETVPAGSFIPRPVTPAT